MKKIIGYWGDRNVMPQNIKAGKLSSLFNVTLPNRTKKCMK